MEKWDVKRIWRQNQVHFFTPFKDISKQCVFFWCHCFTCLVTCHKDTFKIDKKNKFQETVQFYTIWLSILWIVNFFRNREVTEELNVIKNRISLISPADMEEHYLISMTCVGKMWKYKNKFYHSVDRRKDSELASYSQGNKYLLPS